MLYIDYDYKFDCEHKIDYSKLEIVSIKDGKPYLYTDNNNCYIYNSNINELNIKYSSDNEIINKKTIIFCKEIAKGIYKIVTESTQTTT